MSKFDGIKERIWSGIATDDELRALKLEDIVAIKSDGEHMRLRPCVRAKPEKVGSGRRVRHVASDESSDRMGDVIQVRGWDLGPFKKNPQLLFNHNSDAPLGLVPDMTKGVHRGEPALLSESELYTDDKLTEERQVIARLVEDGDLPAVSVGFLPRKVSRPDDSEERTKLGLGEWGVLYEKTELLELSVVTVPANSNALMRKLDSMVESGTLAKSLAAQVAKTWEPSTRTVVAMGDIKGPPASTPSVATAWTLGALSIGFDDNGVAHQFEGGMWRPLVRTFTSTGAAPDVSTDTRLAAIETRQQAIDAQLKEACALLGRINSTLSAELPALKGLLANHRAPSPQSSSHSGTQESTQGADTKSAELVAFLSGLLAEVRAKGAVK